MKNVSEKQTTNLLVIFIILISFLVFFSGIKHFFYVYVLFIGLLISYYFLAGSEDLTIISLLLLSSLIGAGIVILISGVSALVDIPITRWTLLLPLLLCLILIIKFPVDLTKIKMEASWVEWALLLLTVFSLFARVVSVKGYRTPILHDPISHATWAKQIFDTGKINFFYSPGLHILSALGMMVDKVNVATYVLRLTNLFNAFTFLSAFYFLKQTFRNKIGALLGSAIFLIMPMPTNFFWLSGKNGLVTALPFLFLLLYSLQLDLPFKRKVLFSNAIVFVLILAHYPVAAIALIYGFSILLTKKELRGLSFLSIGILLGILWGLSKMKYQLVLDDESVTDTFIAISLSARNLLNFLKGTLAQSIHQHFFTWPDFFTYLGIAALSLTLFIKKIRRGSWLLIALFLSIFVSILINFTPLRNLLHLVYETQLLTYFIFVYLGYAILIIAINEILLFRSPTFLYFQIALCVLIVGMSSVKDYNLYRQELNKKNMVSENDMNAFDWINENIEPGCTILNNAAKNNRSFIVFASDGGAWIPVFTNCDIAMPFTEFSTGTTHQNYEYYSRLLDGTYTCQDISGLINAGITYYYKDSLGVYGPLLNPDTLGDNLKLLYHSDGIEVYSIVPCSP